MGKSRNGYGSGTFLESRVFLSPAFLNLNEKCKKSTQVLILFLGKRFFSKVKVKGKKEMMRSDDNRLTLTYAEAESRGISRPQFTRAIDELLAKGFIKIIHYGGVYNKDKTFYGLVDDFLQWRPGDQPIRKRQQEVRRGFQGAGLGAVKKKSTHAGVPIDRHVDVPIAQKDRLAGVPIAQKREKSQKADNEAL